MPSIKSKRSAIPGRVPTIDQLQLGELALNTYDGRLFLKKSAGGVESIVTLKAQENASFSKLTAGYGLQDGIYDGTSDVVFNVDPREINISELSGIQSFIDNTVFGENSPLNSLNGGISPSSYAITGSNTFRGHNIFSGSMLITSSLNTTFNVTLLEISTTPTPTPTPTPTLTAITSSVFISSTSYAGTISSCAATADLEVWYVGNLENNTVLYSEDTLSTLFDGDGDWYKIGSSNTCRINNSGVISEYQTCNTTPTPTPTITSTPTPTATFTAVPTIYIGSPQCRTNNCNDGKACGVRYSIFTANAPTGAYVTVTKTGGGGSVTVINGTDLPNAKLLRNETSNTEASTAFIIFLRNSSGTPIAQFSGNIGSLSFAASLPLCT